jgi:hypothetical protein
MIKMVAFLIAGLAIGLVLATLRNGTETELDAPRLGAASAFENRIATLERRLADETERRVALERRVAELGDTLPAAGSFEVPDVGRNGVEASAAASAEVAADTDTGADAPPRFGGRRDRGPEARYARLIDAGFAPDRAAWITERLGELQMEALNARYAAARDGAPFDPRGGGEVLRAELGDADYERYLRAIGRPTTVAIGSVLGSSPASFAGLEPGDQIVAYNGQRVFDLGEVHRLTLEGQTGEPVTIDVVRDGQPLQVVVPRGPLGIVAGGGRFGRPN